MGHLRVMPFASRLGAVFTHQIVRSFFHVLYMRRTLSPVKLLTVNEEFLRLRRPSQLLFGSGNESGRADFRSRRSAP
jgi:hypothetical protein